MSLDFLHSTRSSITELTRAGFEQHLYRLEEGAGSIPLKSPRSPRDLWVLGQVPRSPPHQPWPCCRLSKLPRNLLQFLKSRRLREGEFSAQGESFLDVRLVFNSTGHPNDHPLGKAL